MFEDDKEGEEIVGEIMQEIARRKKVELMAE